MVWFELRKLREFRNTTAAQVYKVTAIVSGPGGDKMQSNCQRGPTAMAGRRSHGRWSWSCWNLDKPQLESHPPKHALFYENSEFSWLWEQAEIYQMKVTLHICRYLLQGFLPFDPFFFPNRTCREQTGACDTFHCALWRPKATSSRRFTSCWQ